MPPPESPSPRGQWFHSSSQSGTDEPPPTVASSTLQGSSQDTTIDWIDRQYLRYSDASERGINEAQDHESTGTLSYINNQEIGDDVSSPSQGSRSRKRRKISRTPTPETRKRNVQYTFAGTALPRWIRRDIKKRLLARSVMVTSADGNLLMQSGREYQPNAASIVDNLSVLARGNKKQRRNVDRRLSRRARMATLRYISFEKASFAYEKQQKKIRLANSRRKQGSVLPHPSISRNTFQDNWPQQEVEIPQMKRPLDNPAWRLYLNYLDSEDPVKEWLKHLGIHCSVSVAFDNQNNGRTNVSHTASGIANDASRSVLSNSSNSKKGKNKSKPKVLVKTMDGNQPPPPSKLTVFEMHADCNWHFDSSSALGNPQYKNAKRFGAEKWGDRPLQDVTLAPTRKAGTKTLKNLHRKIQASLTVLKANLASKKLELPLKWLEMSKLTDKPPLYHLPNAYAQYLPDPDWAQRIVGPWRDTSEEPQSTQSADSDPEDGSDDPMETEDTKSDTTIQPQDTTEDCEEIRQYKMAHPLTGSQEEKERVALELEQIIINCNSPRQLHDDTCTLVKMVEASHELRQSIQWCEEAELACKDNLYRIGDSRIPENESYGIKCRQSIMAAFLQYISKPTSSEMAVEKECGHYIKGIIADRDMVEEHNRQVRFPSHLRALGSSPRADSYTRVQPGTKLPWHRDLMPILFGGECKTEKSHNKHTRAQLAASFHATLIILVLYYLDTRPNTDEPMPPWLFLLGIEYVTTGFVIYAHYPRYKFSSDGGKWGFISVPITVKFSAVFKRATTSEVRVRALAALFSIRNHGRYVLDRLAEWTNSEAVLAVLQRRACVERSEVEDTLST